jgi:hypothetical protein
MADGQVERILRAAEETRTALVSTQHALEDARRELAKRRRVEWMYVLGAVAVGTFVGEQLYRWVA